MKKTKEARIKPACSSALFSFIGLNSHHLIPRHLGAASASSIQCKFGLLSIILMWLETDSTKHRVCYWLDLSLLLDCNISVLRDPLQRISWCASPERSYMLDTDPHYQCNKQCKCNSADKLQQSPGNGVEVEAFPHRGPCRRGHLFRKKNVLLANNIRFTKKGRSWRRWIRSNWDSLSAWRSGSLPFLSL